MWSVTPARGGRRWLGVALGVVVVIAVGVIDAGTVPGVSFSLFFIAPVAAVGWTADRGSAVGLALLASITWAISDHAAAVRDRALWIEGWNGVMRTVVLLAVAFLVTALRRTLENERAMARTDALTGAANVRQFRERGGEALYRLKRHGVPITVAYCDIDDFKAINDSRGHAAGDEVLRELAEYLRSRLRAEDVVGRLGGDEFVLLLPGDHDGAVAAALERMVADLEKAKLPSVTIGAVTFTAPPASFDAMIAMADELMYTAKVVAKGTIVHRVVA